MKSGAAVPTAAALAGVTAAWDVESVGSGAIDEGEEGRSHATPATSRATAGSKYLMATTVARARGGSTGRDRQLFVGGMTTVLMGATAAPAGYA